MQPEKLPLGRRIALKLLANVWSLGLLLLPGLLYAAFWLTDENVVKTQLAESGVYKVASNEIVKSSANQTSSIDSQSLPPDILQQSIKEVLTPKVVQQKVEPLLEDNYQWLRRERDQPSVQFDMTLEQQAIAAKVVDKLAHQYDQKPECSVAQIAEHRVDLQTRPLEAPCRIAGIRGETFSQNIRAQFGDFSNATPAGFALAPVSSEPMTKGETVPSPQPINIKPEAWQQGFWWLRYGFYITIATLVVVALLARLITKSWRAWLQWMHRTLKSSGILMLIMSVFGAMIATQTSWPQARMISDELKQVAIHLASPLFILAVSMAVAYIVAAIFAILIVKRGVYSDIKSDAARDAAASPQSTVEPMGAPGQPRE